MKSARWLVVVLLALCAAWFFVKSRETALTPERPQETAVASQTPSGVVEEPHAAVEARAVVPQAAEEAAPAAEAFAPPTIEPAVPARSMLYGFVLPIAGAESLEPPIFLSLTDSHGETRRCEAGPDGAYSFPNLGSARYWIRAQPRSGGEVRAVLELDASGGDRRLDLQLKPIPEIQIELVDTAGEPIRDLMLLAVATLEPPGDWCEVSGSFNNPYGVGRWTANGSPGLSLPASVLGRVRLIVPPPVFISLLHNQRVLATQRIELGRERVRFVLDRGAPQLQKGRLKLRLIDAQTRQPLPGIGLVLASGPTIMFPRTDLDGSYSGSQMPGWLSLGLQGRSYENPAIRVRIEPDRETDLGEIALGGAIGISGQVVDERGQGVAGRIGYSELDPLSGLPIHPHVTAMANCAADGTFSIGALARRRYRLSVENEASAYGVAALHVDAQAGSVAGVRLQLVPGTPCLIRSEDERWFDVEFDLLDAEGTRMVSSRIWGPEPRKILLAPGRYAIDVRVGEQGEAVRREFTIGSETVELSLP